MLPEIEYSLNVAERVARNCVPELSGVPLYLIQPAIGSLVPPEKCAGGGLFVRRLDRILQPELELQGRWRGPGVAIIIDAFWALVNSSDDAEGIRRVVGAVLHEVAHWLDVEETVLAATPVQSHAAFMNNKSNLEVTEPLPSGLTTSFLTHDESFCRLTAHLWHRARYGGGMVLRPSYLCFGNDYVGLEYLPTPGEIIDALWPELESRKGEPLREILKSDAPRAYTDLWLQIYERLIHAAPDAA